MAELILHHYDISPYAEKIRLCFGLKGLAWRSVVVPMVLPKPDLMPLTGGFRRTPVLQIGADIYCDTLRIAMELDRRHPEPPLLDEEGNGFDAILATWAERVLMWPTARYVTGMNRDTLSEPFFRDRSEMRGTRRRPWTRSQPVCRIRKASFTSCSAGWTTCWATIGCIPPAERLGSRTSPSTSGSGG